MEKKKLIGSQISIVLWLLIAAISAIETYKQYLKGGLSNPWVYALFFIFLIAAVMYFYKKRQRFMGK